MPTLSFIAPCFNEEEVLPQTIARLLAAGDATRESFEILLVDDGSSDHTWQQMCDASAGHPGIRGLRLSRNFGQQAAIFAGLDQCSGAFVMLLDADLQDPPELAAPMLAKAREGFDVVVGVRRSRAGESLPKRVTAWIFHRLLNLIAPRPIPVDSGNFSLMSRRAVEGLLAMPGRDRYLRALVSFLDVPKTTLPYDRAPRAAGATHYSYVHLARIAWHAITSSRRKANSSGDERALYKISERTF